MSAVIIAVVAVAIAAAVAVLAVVSLPRRALRYRDHKARLLEQQLDAELPRRLGELPAMLDAVGFGEADGADAGPLLNARLPWTDRPDAELRLDDVVRAQADDEKTSWTTRGEWNQVDCSWMSELRGFGRWDLSVGRAFDALPNREMFPFPDYAELQRWAKVRLASGARQGMHLEALRDVSALARLIFSQSTLVSTMVAVALKRLEAAAVATWWGQGVHVPWRVQSDAELRQLTIAFRYCMLVLQPLAAPRQLEVVMRSSAWPRLRCVLTVEDAFARMQWRRLGRSREVRIPAGEGCGGLAALLDRTVLSPMSDAGEQLKVFGLLGPAQIVVAGLARSLAPRRFQTSVAALVDGGAVPSAARFEDGSLMAETTELYTRLR